MSNLASCPIVPNPRNGTVGQTPKSGTARGTKPGTGNLRLLALNALCRKEVGQAVGQSVGQVVPQGRDKTIPYGTRFALPWPMPEPSPLVVRSEPWKYSCLFALASHFGAGLTKDAGGGLTLTCPATMPQEAAQAARDGLAELEGYVLRRLRGTGQQSGQLGY